MSYNYMQLITKIFVLVIMVIMHLPAALWGGGEGDPGEPLGIAKAFPKPPNQQ